MPEIKGGWVNAKTLEDGFSEIQEVIALALSYYQERDWPMPDSVAVQEGPVSRAVLPVAVEKYHFVTPIPWSHRLEKA